MTKKKLLPRETYDYAVPGVPARRAPGPLSLVTRPNVATGGTEFWLSEPEPMGAGDWGFSVYANKDVFLATFTYPTQAASIHARIAMVDVLAGAIFIAMGKS